MKSDLSKINLKPCNLEEALEVINPMAGIIIEYHAEQQLSPLVISKKLTFGTQSERGSRYIERISLLSRL
jgi:hypothetical protein